MDKRDVGDKTQANQNGDGTSEQPSLEATAQDRREALRKISRYSAYAAPAMMAMLSKQAVAY